MPPKEILREKVKKQLAGISREDFHAQGACAAASLRSSGVWSSYTTIFLFLSMRSEIDTQPLLELALKEGKKVFAPRVEAYSGTGEDKIKDRLVFYPVLSPDGPWDRGPFGIREPAAVDSAGENSGSPCRVKGKGAEAGDFPALILVPGIAFDRKGNRLGRGGGYYDRFFAELDNEGRQYCALGLCMDFQISGEVPSGDQDKKMNGFLTGKELYFIIPQS